MRHAHHDSEFLLLIKSHFSYSDNELSCRWKRYGLYFPAQNLLWNASGKGQAKDTLSGYHYI